MPPFVVLRHDHPQPHFDLLLDDGHSLRTWRLARLPAAGVETTCESLPAHRRIYLEYEGPVSGGRGTVARELAGRYEIVDESADGLRLLLILQHHRLAATLAPPTGAGLATFRPAAE